MWVPERAADLCRRRIRKACICSEPVDRLREHMRDKIKRENIRNVTVLDGSVEWLPFEDDSFDIVMSGHVVGDDYACARDDVLGWLSDAGFAVKSEFSGCDRRPFTGGPGWDIICAQKA